MQIQLLCDSLSTLVLWVILWNLMQYILAPDCKTTQWGKKSRGWKPVLSAVYCKIIMWNMMFSKQLLLVCVFLSRTVLIIRFAVFYYVAELRIWPLNCTRLKECRRYRGDHHPAHLDWCVRVFMEEIQLLTPLTHVCLPVQEQILGEAFGPDNLEDNLIGL